MPHWTISSCLIKNRWLNYPHMIDISKCTELNGKMRKRGRNKEHDIHIHYPTFDAANSHTDHQQQAMRLH